MIFSCAVSALTLTTIYHSGSVGEGPAPEKVVRPLGGRVTSRPECVDPVKGTPGGRSAGTHP